MSPKPLYEYLNETCPFFVFKYKEPTVDQLFFKLEIYTEDDLVVCFAILYYNTDGSYYDLVACDQGQEPNFIDLECARKIVKVLESVEEFNKRK